jgi:hypothetical protein
MYATHPKIYIHTHMLSKYILVPDRGMFAAKKIRTRTKLALVFSSVCV